MNKISEKAFLIISGIIVGIIAVITSFLVMFEVISQAYEFPVYATLFTICVVMSAFVDKLYFKNNWNIKQTIGMIVFSIITIIGTILVWIFK